MPAPLKPTALVIDDELQMRRLLRVCLEANGYRVSEAATGKDGIAEAAQHPPDVVILDLGLPDMEGIAVLKRLREWSLSLIHISEPTRRTPISYAVFCLKK